MIDVAPLEALYVAINGTAVLVTALLLRETRKDLVAVRELNGHAREIAVSGDVRREGIRLAVQSLLLSLAVPGLFDARPVPLNPFVLTLMAISLLLLVQSFMDLRERRRLMDTIAREMRVPAGGK